MYLCALRRGAASVLCGQSQRAASLATKAGPAGTAKSATQGEQGDTYIWKEHCKGSRRPSKDAKELSEKLRKSDFGALRRAKASAAEHAAGQDRAPPGTPCTMHTSAAAAAEQRSTEDAAQELVERGSKRLMQSEDGWEELRQGTFDLDRTADRVLEEGKKDSSPEAAGRADEEDVKASAKSRVVSGSQAS